MSLIAFIILIAVKHDIKWKPPKDSARWAASNIIEASIFSFAAYYWTYREPYFLPLLPFLCSLAWWRCFSSFVTVLWPKLLHFVPHWVVKGGPLGEGLSKLCEVLVGLLLWYFAGPEAGLQSFPTFLQPAFAPSSLMVWTVVTFSMIVNLVLQLWSNLLKSRGNHSGVNRLVRGSLGRKLTRRERLELFSLAAMNALCEELSSRVLWRSIFAVALVPTIFGKEQSNWLETVRDIPASRILTNASITLYSNLGQAMMFGIRHYNGIPSGLTGVGLTFIYGFLLGWMADQAEGSIWLPLISHTIADFYIFSVLVRKNIDRRDKTKYSNN